MNTLASDLWHLGVANARTQADGVLFPAITADDWRRSLARARATPNSVTEQIKSLQRGAPKRERSETEAEDKLEITPGTDARGFAAK